MELKFKHTDIGFPSSVLIKNANFTLKKGELSLLMGNNGMGKTTLIKSILNQTPLLSGSIHINDQSVDALNHQDIAKKVAVVFSSKKIPYNYTTKDLISLGRFIHYPYYFELTPKDKDLVQSIIKRLGLEEYENRPLRLLSDGNLQKAFIGRALVQETDIIILDEPTAHLDETNKIMLYKLLRKLAIDEGKIILFSSHDWRLAKVFSNKIAYIKNKSIQFGSVEEITSKNKELSDVPSFDSLGN